MEHPDQKYFDALVNNERILIDEIYAKHFPFIKNMIKQSGGDQDDAKDIFQEALVVCFIMAKEGRKLSCYLGRLLDVICTRKWINERKKRGRTTGIKSEDLSAAMFTEESIKIAEETWLMLEQMNLIQKKLEELTKNKQNLLKLQWGGRSNTEIAQMLNMSHGAVRTGISDGRKELIIKTQKDPDFKLLKN